jgi:hypothetical protein
MDINNIKNRMERVYLSIGQRLDDNINKHINIEYKRDIDEKGKYLQATISFGEKNKPDVVNQVFIIISHIAKLKDHLKNLYASKGGNQELIENEIESSEHLKLVIDLDNQEKHGELKKSRSQRYPYLDEIGPVLSLGGNKQGKTSSFIINPFTGENKVEGSVVIAIDADVKSKNGKIICNLDELINKSMEKWEEIIKKNLLI